MLVEFDKTNFELAMVSQGYKLKDISEKIDYSISMVSLMTSNKRRMDFNTLYEIADILDVHPNYLVRKL